MGSENSKAEERQRKSVGQSGITRAEVNRLLAQQKKEYERKLTEMKIQSTSGSAAQNVVTATEVRERNADVIVNQFRELLVQHSAPPNPSARTPPPQQPGSSSAGYSPLHESFKDHSPLNHNAAQTSKSFQSNLYPSLDFGNAHNVPVLRSPSDSEDFVFIGDRQRNMNCQRVQPSAPQLPAANKNTFTPKASTSRPQKNTKDDTFSCKSCGNKYGLNIFLCSMGHSSCSDCKNCYKPCGICGDSIGNTRNFALESYLSDVTNASSSQREVKVQCPNASDGCKLSFWPANIQDHLKECPFSDCNCPLAELFNRCSWRGKISQMSSHFDDVHPGSRQGNVDREMHLVNIFDDQHYVCLVKMESFNFLVHLKVNDDKRSIYMTVQFLGTQISASKWTYEVHIYDKREPRKKMYYTDVCHSHSKSVNDIFEECKCLVVPQQYAMNFFNDGSLTYKFYIKLNEMSDNNNQIYSSVTPRGRGGRGRGRGRGPAAGRGKGGSDRSRAFAKMATH